MENLELGAVQSALGRVVALHCVIPAIECYNDCVKLYQAPVVIKIQEMWDVFSGLDQMQFGIVFYQKLLTGNPQLLIGYFFKTDMDALTWHLCSALDMVIKNVSMMGTSNTLFCTSLEKLGEIHRIMQVPAYSYALVGATILECFQPLFDAEEAAAKDTDGHVSAADLWTGLAKV